MTDYIKLAREVGLHLPYWDDKQNPKIDPPYGWSMVSPIGPPLERFAKAVRAAALEDAAVEFEGLYSLGGDDIAKCLRAMKESNRV